VSLVASAAVGFPATDLVTIVAKVVAGRVAGDGVVWEGEFRAGAIRGFALRGGVEKGNLILDAEIGKVQGRGPCGGLVEAVSRGAGTGEEVG
jgi:hypothetical protein